MNGITWQVKFVCPYNPMLIDRTDTLRVATTDPTSRCIFLSEELEGDFLRTVFIHELGHCAIFSFNLLYDIHKMVEPYFWVEAEEWICNFLADYGMLIFDTAYSVLGDEAIGVVINQMEQLVA